MLTDGTANVEWEAAYRPFGELLAQSGPEAINIRFPGQFEDQETGLYYNYFRTYNPALGRYLESDPIGLAGGWNTYAYVGGNPQKFSDPRGLAVCRYTTATGEMICWSNAYDDTSGPVFEGTFISGNNLNGTNCKNNAKCMYERDRGPIPEGWWKWTNDWTGKPNGRVLEPIDALADPVLPGGRDLFRTHSCGPAGGRFVFSDAASAGFNAYNADGTTRVTTCSAGCIVGTVEDAQALNRALDGDPNSILYVTAGSGWISWRDAPM